MSKRRRLSESSSSPLLLVQAIPGDGTNREDGSKSRTDRRACPPLCVARKNCSVLWIQRVGLGHERIRQPNEAAEVLLHSPQPLVQRFGRVVLTLASRLAGTNYFELAAARPASSPSRLTRAIRTHLRERGIRAVISQRSDQIAHRKRRGSTHSPIAEASFFEQSSSGVVGSPGRDF